MTGVRPGSSTTSATRPGTARPAAPVGQQPGGPDEVAVGRPVGGIGGGEARDARVLGQGRQDLVLPARWTAAGAFRRWSRRRTYRAGSVGARSGVDPNVMAIASGPVPLSVLDLATVADGSSPAQALAEVTDLARQVEPLGYRRLWVAEHHGMPAVASSAPAVLIAHLAAATETIRVGSGGVMLPNHAPLVVAEQFATLEALHPGRIDLGLGRAPGTDPRTARALRRTADLDADRFPDDLVELIGYFAGTIAHPRPVPGEGYLPEIWLLGSSLFSAELAGMLGLPFSFAHHFMPAVHRAGPRPVPGGVPPVGRPRPAARHGRRGRRLRPDRRRGPVPRRPGRPVDGAAPHRPARARCRRRRRPRRTATRRASRSSSTRRRPAGSSAIRTPCGPASTTWSPGPTPTSSSYEPGPRLRRPGPLVRAARRAWGVEPPAGGRPAGAKVDGEGRPAGAAVAG